MRRPHAIPVIALAACLLAAPGCQRFRDRIKARREARQEAKELRRLEEAGIVTAPPSAQGEPGLEIVVWTCDDTQFAVGRLLAPYLDQPVPMAEADRAAWRALGLRVVAVPVSQVDALIAASRPITPVQRQRFGLLAWWTPVVRGPALPGSVPGPDARLIKTDGGRARLIARTWTEPDLSTGTLRDVVRADLAIQVESRSRPLPDITQIESRPAITDAGLVIESSLTSFTADGRTAIVIVAEEPGVDYASLPEPVARPDPLAGATAGPGVADSAGPPAEAAPATPAAFTPSGTGIGPTPPRDRTLGEWMLSSPGVTPVAGRPGQGPRKVFVVLVPNPGGQPAPNPSQAPAPATPPAPDA